MKFPSGITRAQASGGDSLDRKPPRRGPTPAEFAMMSSKQLKIYYQRTGQWPEKVTQDAQPE